MPTIQAHCRDKQTRLAFDSLLLCVCFAVATSHASFDARPATHWTIDVSGWRDSVGVVIVVCSGTAAATLHTTALAGACGTAHRVRLLLAALFAQRDHDTTKRNRGERINVVLVAAHEQVIARVEKTRHRMAQFADAGVTFHAQDTAHLAALMAVVYVHLFQVQFGKIALADKALIVLFGKQRIIAGAIKTVAAQSIVIGHARTAAALVTALRTLKLRFCKRLARKHLHTHAALEERHYGALCVAVSLRRALGKLDGVDWRWRRNFFAAKIVCVALQIYKFCRALGLLDRPLVRLLDLVVAARAATGATARRLARENLRLDDGDERRRRTRRRLIQVITQRYKVRYLVHVHRVPPRHSISEEKRLDRSDVRPGRQRARVWTRRLLFQCHSAVRVGVCCIDRQSRARAFLYLKQSRWKACSRVATPYKGNNE